MINVSDLADKISALPPLRNIIDAHDLRAKKSLGQNFLLDLNLTDKIARAAGDLSKTHVIEIGPGPGGLTRALLKQNPLSLTAIEFDARAVAALQSLQDIAAGQFKIIEADALEIDITDITPSPRAIIANLPYNIATPLLIGWLKKIYEGEGQIHSQIYSMTLMFQKEVAQRITARPGEKSYGRLAVLSQWLCNVKKVMDIPPSAFTPPPKIISSVVHFVPRKNLFIKPAFHTLETVTAAAFGQRRKMIRSSLKKYSDAMESLGMDTEKRAENLNVEEFLKLAEKI